jgi:hypothetical protein
MSSNSLPHTLTTHVDHPHYNSCRWLTHFNITTTKSDSGHPNTPPTEALTSPQRAINASAPLALSEQLNAHLEATVEELKARLEDMKAERDQALQDAREDRNKVMALLEDQRPRSFWSRMFK